jgi:hypothetical protein
MNFKLAEDGVIRVMGRIARRLRRVSGWDDQLQEVAIVRASDIPADIGCIFRSLPCCFLMISIQEIAANIKMELQNGLNRTILMQDAGLPVHCAQGSVHEEPSR